MSSYTIICQSKLEMTQLVLNKLWVEMKSVFTSFFVVPKANNHLNNFLTFFSIVCRFDFESQFRVFWLFVAIESARTRLTFLRIGSNIFSVYHHQLCLHATYSTCEPFYNYFSFVSSSFSLSVLFIEFCLFSLSFGRFVPLFNCYLKHFFVHSLCISTCDLHYEVFDTWVYCVILISLVCSLVCSLTWRQKNSTLDFVCCSLHFCHQSNF